MSDTQCEICGELLDCPENDFGDGESLGHTLDCPVPLGGGALTAIVSTPRPSDPYQALADLTATRAQYVHDGETYGIDVTDHDEEPVLRESIGERSRESRGTDDDLGRG